MSAAGARLVALEGRRPSTLVLVLDQTVYAMREQWRSRMALVFTFVLPLTWLVLVGLLVPNDLVDETTGVRVMQFVTPTAAAMGVLYAAFPPVAGALAMAREQKISKRLAGTPVPGWTYLLGRALAASVIAVAAVVLMLAIGVAFFGVAIQTRTLPATVVTLLAGIVCLAVLGLAVGALAHSANSAQTVALGTAVLLMFLSGMIASVGSPLPAWMDAFGSLFPPRHLLTSLQEQFNPYKTGGGWVLLDLAVVAAWAAAGLLVAVWALRRETRYSTGTAQPSSRPRAGGGLLASTSARPSSSSLVLDQAVKVNTSAWRDVAFVIFGIGMPIGLYVLMASQYSKSDLRPFGMPFGFFFVASMSAYATGVTAFVSLAEIVALARDNRILKRLRGTPLASWQYLAGLTVWCLAVAFFMAAATLAIGFAAFDVRVAPEGLPLGIGIMALGTLTLAACGFALAAVVPNSKSMSAISLAILLPLSFVSEVFAMGDKPDWMTGLGSIFPLRHFVMALASSLNPAGSMIPWTDIAVMAAWLAGASIVAVRFFRWEPRV